MNDIVLAHQTDFAGWRDAARGLIAAHVRPEMIGWRVGHPGLFSAASLPQGDGANFTVPRGFIDLAQQVIQASDPERFAVLYGLLYRIAEGERHILNDATHPLVVRAHCLAKSVRRDTHKMRAFLRFREVAGNEGPLYAAWFEPEHYIVDANAGFFQRRFASLNWIIMTPYRCLRWDGSTLFTADGADKSMLPEDDAMKTLWDTYFASIFNPARLKVKAMMSEMPKKYWKNMPETALIFTLAKSASARTAAMIDDSRLEL